MVTNVSRETLSLFQVALKTKTVCSETLVSSYKITRRHKPVHNINLSNLVYRFTAGIEIWGFNCGSENLGCDFNGFLHRAVLYVVTVTSKKFFAPPPLPSFW